MLLCQRLIQSIPSIQHVEPLTVHQIGATPLLSYHSFIKNYKNQDVLKIILSRSARSARLTTHFDLDFPKAPTTGPYECYKHSRVCSPTENARQFLTRYSHDTLKRIREYSSIRKSVEAEVVCGDSRYVEFPKCDLVITSPPYVGLIDYHEQHRYAYELLGIPWQADQEIGRASQGSSLRAQQQYKEQIKEVFSNVRQYLTRSVSEYWLAEHVGRARGGGQW